MYSLILHSGIVFYYATAWIGLLPFLLKPSKGTQEDERLTTMRDIKDRYLTVWNFTLQTVMFIGYLACDVLEIKQKLPRFKRKLKGFLDQLFYSIVAPASLFVTVMFWPLYLCDPHLVYIYPTMVGETLTPWANHTLHTGIVVTVLLQALLSKKSPVQLSVAHFRVVQLALAYVICLYGTYYQKNIWVYPFLIHLPEPLRFFCLLLMLALFLSLNYVFHRLNGLYCS